MIAAIYARKSPTAESVSDDAKSTTRQVEGGRALALQHGWAILEDWCSWMTTSAGPNSTRALAISA
jgi:hypothetical protein